MCQVDAPRDAPLGIPNEAVASDGGECAVQYLGVALRVHSSSRSKGPLAIDAPHQIRQCVRLYFQPRVLQPRRIEDAAQAELLRGRIGDQHEADTLRIEQVRCPRPERAGDDSKVTGAATQGANPSVNSFSKGRQAGQGEGRLSGLVRTGGAHYNGMTTLTAGFPSACRLPAVE